MKAKRLLLLTDVEGVLDKNGQLIKSLTTAEAQALIDDGTISGGMIPKIESCIDVIAEGVEGVVIINGKVPHAVLLELFTEHGAGTLIERRRREERGGGGMSDTADPRLRLRSCRGLGVRSRQHALPGRLQSVRPDRQAHGRVHRSSFGMPLDEAQSLRETYYYEHGTTLAGLVRLHGMSPDDFLDYVHDIDLGAVLPSPELAAALGRLPGRKFIFTNGSRKHAEAVAERLGVIEPVRGYLRHPRARIHLPEADARGL